MRDQGGGQRSFLLHQSPGSLTPARRQPASGRRLRSTCERHLCCFNQRPRVPVTVGVSEAPSLTGGSPANGSPAAPKGLSLAPNALLATHQQVRLVTPTAAQLGISSKCKGTPHPRTSRPRKAHPWLQNCSQLPDGCVSPAQTPRHRPAPRPALRRPTRPLTLRMPLSCLSPDTSS